MRADTRMDGHHREQRKHWVWLGEAGTRTRASVERPREKHMSEPRDAVSRLQVSVTDLAGVYLDALKDVQNTVEEQHGNTDTNARDRMMDELTSTLAERVVSLHESIDRQAEALERAYRSETEQMDVLQKLHAEHLTVTEELRVDVQTAETLQTSLRGRLDALVDGIHELNAKHRDVPARPGGRAPHD